MGLLSAVSYSENLYEIVAASSQGSDQIATC